VLNIFQASCPVKYEGMTKKKNWITQVMKVSSKHKRSLYTFTKYSNDPKPHYIKYCKIIKRHSVPKCWHLNYRRWEITQQKAYDSIFPVPTANLFCVHCVHESLIVIILIFSKTIYNSAGQLAQSV
jgi:hypothetical protein